MAKLKARNRKELARVTTETNTPNDELISWARATHVLMSDGAILGKRDVMFRPDTFNPAGRRHSYGWTLLGTRKTLTAEEFVANHVAQGWTRV